jgi:putative transposase
MVFVIYIGVEMTKNINNEETVHTKWACFRLSVIGSLLTSPPEKGYLSNALKVLAKKQWVHPINSVPVNFSYPTIERWFYKAKKSNNPINTLRTKVRSDVNKTPSISIMIKQLIQQQYKDHPSWSYQLHKDNIGAQIKETPEYGNLPSYSTLYRYMSFNNMKKRRVILHKETPGSIAASDRLESLEVRSFEMDHVNALWHLDFHHGKRKVLDKDGQWKKPLLLCIMDDRSRLVCHLQWYFEETTEALSHGFIQALQKRGLPRSIMSDNGAAMTSGEFTQGLQRLSILHETTLPYSPYQNAKQEVFWGQVEGRLMAMLENEPEITLSLLNNATLAWAEIEYHRKHHSEIGTTPLKRYMAGPDVVRKCPDSKTLRQSFCIQVKRKQRRSDGTFTLDGSRIEIPSHYRHLEQLHVRYARWDLSYVQLIDPKTDKILSPLYPLDKSANATGYRRKLKPAELVDAPTATGIAPLLKNLMAEYSATGLPPAYIPKDGA